MWTYSQGTGDVEDQEGAFLARGYSGFMEGKNNGSMEAVHDVGPIPRGIWIMAAVFDSPSHGPFCIRLVPRENTVTFGRDGFLIHGDSISHPGYASHGCIILPRAVREALWRSDDPQIKVIE